MEIKDTLKVILIFAHAEFRHNEFILLFTSFLNVEALNHDIQQTFLKEK